MSSRVFDVGMRRLGRMLGGWRLPPVGGVRIAGVLLMCGAAGCGTPEAQSGPHTEQRALTAGASGHAATPHGDHSPHHGGTVLMFGDLHYEVVLPPTGGAALHLTDDVRRDLPASVVSHVVIELARPGHEAEALELQPDPSGAFWTAPGPAVTDPATVVRVGFGYDDQTVSVELPFATYFRAPSREPAEGTAVRDGDGRGAGGR